MLAFPCKRKPFKHNEHQDKLCKSSKFEWLAIILLSSKCTEFKLSFSAMNSFHFKQWSLHNFNAQFHFNTTSEVPQHFYVQHCSFKIWESLPWKTLELIYRVGSHPEALQNNSWVLDTECSVFRKDWNQRDSFLKLLCKKARQQRSYFQRSLHLLHP